jgi:hypothetical protein
VVYSSFPHEWALGEADEPEGILLVQFLKQDLQECGSEYKTATCPMAFLSFM